MIDFLIKTPFGYVLEFFYGFFENYGIALILFAALVQLILLPNVVVALTRSGLIPARYSRAGSFFSRK